MQSFISIIAGIVPIFNSETLVVSNLAKELTVAEYTDGDNNVAVYAFITVENDQIRYWLDGSDPTLTEGHLVDQGGNIFLKNSSDVKNFRAIRITADATLQISYGG